MYHSSYLGVSFGQIKASTAPIAIPIFKTSSAVQLQHLSAIDAKRYLRSLAPRSFAFEIETFLPAHRYHPLTTLSVATTEIFKEQRRKVEQEGSFPQVGFGWTRFVKDGPSGGRSYKEYYSPKSKRRYCSLRYAKTHQAYIASNYHREWLSTG